MMRYAVTAAMVLLSCSMVDAAAPTDSRGDAGGNDAGPAQRTYLDLQARYRLAGLGVDLDVTVSDTGTLYLGSAAKGRLWRLDNGQLSAFADQRRCAQGGRVWPSAIAGDLGGGLWVFDRKAERVQVISADGRSLGCRSVAADLDAGRGGHRDPTAIGHGLLLSTDRGSPRLYPAPPNMGECIAAGDRGLGDLYCIDGDGRRVLRFHQGKSVAAFSLPGRYPRAGGLARGDDGAIYLSDAAAARLYRLSADLKLQYRLPLYEGLLRSPGHLHIHQNSLWLVDEGRQELLRFRLRRAQTPLQHRLLGEEFLSLDLYGQALTELERAGRGRADTRQLIARALYGLQRYQQAASAFARLRGDTGIDADSRVAAGFWAANSLFRLGRLEAALAAYRRIARHPGDYARAAAFNEAQTLLVLQRYDDAAQAFRALARQWPRDPGIRLGAARAALGRGDADTAITLLSVPPIAPGASRSARDARLTLGLARLAAGSVRQALPLLQQAARQGPHFRQALNALARAQRTLGQHQQAAQTRAVLITLPQRSAAMNAYILEDQQP